MVTKLRNSEIKIPSKTKLASGTGEIGLWNIYK